MVVQRNVGTASRGIKRVSELASPSGVAETATTLITVNDDAVLDEWKNNGVPVHRLKGDGRMWVRILPSAPVSPVAGDIWLEDDIVLGVVLRVQSSSGLLTFETGDGALAVTAATALLQGHAVRAAADGLRYANNTVDAAEQYRVIGLVAEDTLATNDAIVVTKGQHLELSDWSLLTGAAALTPGSTYWLSATPGRYITTPDSTVAAKVGVAVTSTTLLVDPGFVVLQ